jgi:hypothetical protein
MAFVPPPTEVTVGSVLTASRYNEDVVDNMTELAPLFSAWTSWTPIVAQGVSTNITKTVNYAKYLKVGRLVIANCRLDITGTGTAGSGLTISLDAAITAASTGPRVGGVHVFDSSTSTRYTGQAEFTSTTTVSFVGDWAGGGAWGTNPNIALASGDQIGFSIMYEAAS